MNTVLEKKWFMIHTYSGYEKKVKTDLEQKIEALGMNEIVTKILVPEEQSVELRRGKKKTISRKLFPGYVMLEMVATREESENGINYSVDSDAWYVVRNTNGVTGFVGVGSDPIPMEEEEVENIFRVIGYSVENSEKEDAELVAVDFEVGDYVVIEAEGFVGQRGKVAEINLENRKVKVMMEMFGRLTPIEANITDVKKED
ncbi:MULTISPECIES: transcription termination/antitermination protein NusG [Fusobacterium]|mgnify:CR=1 FL=1|uniref:transcription termination/antitermination protein NusG n=1 Tax=Fusobacterium TaxID=848 RepID=UPI0015A654AE|nr:MULTISPECIES: transcription termination/antitermination protein NusG [Fusobacterium]MCF2611698.1 transcription termination/antitermination factor NusG [Fusobacterium perfoetens]MDY2980932.1 transcription termination/antitermination protein NusG [Fusobacterium sp.]